MARVCVQCGAVRGTYSNHCDACQHRRRQTQQQRNRRTGNHIPDATLDSGDVSRLAEVRGALAELARRFEAARQRAEQNDKPVGPLVRDTIIELSRASVILDELANGALAETLAAIGSKAPRRYGTRGTQTHPRRAPGG